jgi:hypothetical protein
MVTLGWVRFGETAMKAKTVQVLKVIAWGVGGAIAAAVIGGTICCILTWGTPVVLL